MHADDYQKAVRTTAIYPWDKGLEYLALGLASEAGEVAGKISKLIRDHEGFMAQGDVEALTQELGDVQWFLAELSTHLGVQLSQVMTANLTKLASRAERGTLGGSGDER